LTTDREGFLKYNGPKINYSKEILDGSLNIAPHGLLFELNIYFQEVTYHDFYDYNGLFLTEAGSDLHFDPFAASFFMVTRYEELTNDMRDQHDRFLPTHSIAYKYGFLGRPVVDEWALLIKKEVLRLFPGTKFTERSFQFISTIDVDQAFAYKHRQVFRYIGGFAKSLIRFDFRELSRQMSVYAGNSKDPFDTFKYIEETHKKYGIKPYLFVLFARYGKYDKNNSIHSQGFRELIRYLTQFAEIGLHPSYTSNFDFLLLKEEMKRLAHVSNNWIKSSRQHFLKLKLPQSYYNLIKLGVQSDFSMGYARVVGFRAGTCTPYNYFDIRRNEEMDIKVFPFQVMDRALQKYLKQSPNEAVETIAGLVENVKKVNGTFVSLWHNDALSNYGEYKGWRNVYRRMLEMVYA
jgi:hypothetical protein